MREKAKIQHIPIKVYRSTDRLTVAAPTPGLQPEDIVVKVTDENLLIVQGELRGILKDIKELLLDEWSVGGYYREFKLSGTVNGEQANVTYGNGVLVISLPISQRTVPAVLRLERVGLAHGERAGMAGRVQP